MSTVDRAIARLEAGATDDLVRRGMDHLLSRPVAELVDPAWVAKVFCETLETVSNQPRTEEWVRERVDWMRTHVGEGPLRDRVPAEVSDPLNEVLAKPVVFERELMGRLLDHTAVEQLLKDVLVSAIEGFVKPTRDAASAVASSQAGQAARGRLGRLRAISGGVLGVGGEMLEEIQHEVEVKTRKRVSEFVEGAIHIFVERLGDRLTDDAHAQAYADYRVHLFNTVLDTHLGDLSNELDKLDPEGLVETGAAVARSIARREDFQTEVATVIQTALDEVGDGSLRSFLEESGVGEDWRTDVEAELSRQARAFVATDEFRSWFEELLAD